jgi:hypothetical protein
VKDFSVKQMLEDVVTVTLRCARKYSRETETQCEEETYLLPSPGNACKFYIEKDFQD